MASIYFIPKFIKNPLQIEYIKLINKNIIKYEKKYVDSFNPIIFIPSFALDSFSLTNLYIFIDKGKA